MKYFIIVLVFSLNLFSQFSSNVDYKELSRNKNSFGVIYSNSMAETEWKTNITDVSDTLKFTGNYDLFKNSLNLNGHYYLGVDRLTYSAGFSISNFTSSVSIDTLGVREKTDFGESKLSNFNGKLGYIVGEDKYGGYIGLSSLSFDSNDRVDECISTSFNGFISTKTSSGNKYGLNLTYSIFTDDSVVNRASSFEVISPELNVGLYYSIIGEEYIFKLYSDVNIFDSGLYEDDSFIGFGLLYHRTFKNINSELEIDLGSNLSSGFELPNIPLPYIYYGISLENKLFDDKVKLTIGWNYEVYNTALKNFDDIAAEVPVTYPTVLNLEEDLIKNKLFIAVDYLF